MVSIYVEIFNGLKLSFESLKEIKEIKENSREKSLALTKIEEAMMWLNKHRAMIGDLKKSKTHVQ